MVYIFRLFDLNIRISPPFPITITDDTKEFMIPVSDGEPIMWDLELKFVHCQSLQEKEVEGTFCLNRILCHKDDEWWVAFLPYENLPPYAVTCWKEGSREILCYYQDNSEDYMNLSRNFFHLLSSETLAYRFGGFLLHASLIRKKDGKTIVFSAPAQTGKSTQASLWEKHRGAEVLNGDRAAVLPDGEGLRAFGLPFAGTSGIYRNESGMVEAIVILRQAPYNKVTPIKGAMIARYLYSEVMIQRWDAQFSGDMLERICTLPVPVYLLECRPDEGAIEALETVLSK